VSEDRVEYDPYDVGNGDVLRTSVAQNGNGDCVVVEHDIKRKTDRTVAVFMAEERKVIVSNGEEAVRDMAQMRAMLYAQTVETLANQGKIDLG